MRCLSDPHPEWFAATVKKVDLCAPVNDAMAPTHAEHLARYQALRWGVSGHESRSAR
jgi:hypothetical protein